MINIIFTDEVLKTEEFIKNKEGYAINSIKIIWYTFRVDHNEDTDLFLYPELDRFISVDFWEKHSIRHGKKLIRFLKKHTNYNIYFSIDLYCGVYHELKELLN